MKRPRVRVKDVRKGLMIFYEWANGEHSDWRMVKHGDSPNQVNVRLWRTASATKIEFVLYRRLQATRSRRMNFGRLGIIADQAMDPSQIQDQRESAGTPFFQ